MAGTRKVRMLVGITGYRHDGRPWPPIGGKIDVPEWEAADLILGRNAEDASEDREAQDGERVQSWTPAGTSVSARPGLTPEEVMTGHPAGHDKAAGTDYRPPSQVEAEAEAQAEGEGEGEGEDGASRAPSRAEVHAAAREETASARAGDRESALAYAEHGVSGAPGSEVPARKGKGKVPARGEGVRPESQAEAEDMGRAADESDWAVAERESRQPQAGEQQVTSAEPEAEAEAEAEPGNAEGHGVAHVMAPVAETPSPGDPKQAWVDYAVASGADVHEAGSMTKADLMSRYGGRL